MLIATISPRLRSFTCWEPVDGPEYKAVASTFTTACQTLFESCKAEALTVSLTTTTKKQIVSICSNLIGISLLLLQPLQVPAHHQEKSGFELTFLRVIQQHYELLILLPQPGAAISRGKGESLAALNQGKQHLSQTPFLSCEHLETEQSKARFPEESPQPYGQVSLSCESRTYPQSRYQQR